MVAGHENDQFPPIEATGLLPPNIHSYHPAVVNGIFEILKTFVPVKEQRFMDDMEYLRVGQEPGKTVVIPAWIVAPYWQNIGRVMSMINAVRRVDRKFNIGPITEQVIVVSPYMECRSDHLAELSVTETNGDDWVIDSINQGKVVLPGETIYTEMTARMLEGTDILITMDLHSKEALDTLREKIPWVMHLSAFPLFADWVREHNLIKPNTRILALDFGSLAREEFFSILLGGIKIVRGGKYRPKHNKAEVKILTGEDIRDVIMLTADEVIDTFGTIDEWLNELHNQKVSEVYVFSTSGRLSGPAIARIRAAINKGYMVKIVTTNNLPNAEMLKIFPQAEVLDVIPVFTAALRSIMQPDPTYGDKYGIQRFIFNPDSSRQVLERLLASKLVQPNSCKWTGIES